jgi:hypothetical protein
MPEHFSKFLVHVAVWHAYIDNPSSDWSEYEAFSEAQYDSKFENEVCCTTEGLKAELITLRKQATVSV